MFSDVAKRKSAHINVKEYRVRNVYAFSPFESCAFVTLRTSSRIEPQYYYISVRIDIINIDAWIT